jgi:hypothetical protein
MEPESKEPPERKQPEEPNTRSASTTRTEPARDFAALWSSDEATRSFAATPSGAPVDLPFLFAPNQRFGPYLIVRPLGKGGMGQVYEVEETDSGRRIALKLLSRGLGDDEERERFLREGRLAASLSHPNCVYVFGTSEIQGFPVIAMELVPEGTLKDRVVPEAPMSPAAAVDAVLQVIAGLDAAASIGILHRDIKPSNCFVHRDDRVLVGDFGLSVAAQGSRATGTILGTPGFASPEQLRGDDLDVRSDIYSVGATLFYLLAGRAPFEDKRTTGLIEKVATEQSPLLTTVRPEVPAGLARVVSRCLAKTPQERYADYAQLRAALEPFGAARLARGPIVRRAMAGWIDVTLLGLPVTTTIRVSRLFPLSPSHPGHALLSVAINLLFSALYFGVLEGLYGAAIGKAIFGLRVVDAAQVAPGLRRGVERALTFTALSQLVIQAITLPAIRLAPEISPGLLQFVTGAASLVALFCTARPSSGYLALHDRLSRTRVVKARVRAEARQQDRAVVETSTPFDGTQRVGPYFVAEDVQIPVTAPVRVVGFDDRLQRRLWIEVLPSGTPPLAAKRRDLDRPARVRWLGGRRDGADCWDAYEAIDGRVLSDVTSTPHRWSRVRHWLGDLATELAAGFGDGTVPPLDYATVWIGRDRARFLDVSVAPDEADPVFAQRFLYGVAVGALLGIPARDAEDQPPRTPLPLSARNLLLSLQKKQFTSPAAMLGAVTSAIAAPTALARRHRAMQIAASALFPIAVTLVTLGTLVTVRDKDTTPLLLWYTALAVCAGTMTVPMMLAGIGAIVTGSGFTFRPFGAALVNRQGKRASRVRALWRAAITWWLVIPALILTAFTKRPNYRVSVMLVQTAILIGMFAAAAWAIARPTRGIQDRLSGTWIVPR